MMWRRYIPFPEWHCGAEDLHSFCTLCRGRWSLSEEAAGHVERSDDPPHKDRCELCQRERIEQIRVERGLAELVALAPHVNHCDPPCPVHICAEMSAVGFCQLERGRVDPNNPLGFDLGGES